MIVGLEILDSLLVLVAVKSIERKLIGNKRSKRYFVDYLLTYKNTNLAIAEAKSEDKDPLDGLQKSINYAQKLKIDYVYSTNGKGNING